MVNRVAVDPEIQPSSSAVSARMSRQARKDTGPELALRRELHSRGQRYRVHLTVPGWSRRTIDIAFPRLQVAIFVDGCFWHGCPQHGTAPKANDIWWAKKLAENRCRDTETNEYLKDHGWDVVRIWEHESTDLAANRVETVVRAARKRIEREKSCA